MWHVSPHWKRFDKSISAGGMMLNQDFKEFIESLNANQVRYLVVGVTVNFIDLENLRKNKKASGRHQDLADLENLE
jgi:hypothetical protein